MKKITLITCTRSSNIEDFQKRPIHKSIEKLCSLYPNNLFDFKICTNNSKGLSEVYNSYLDKEEYNKDILLFVHDDVEIVDTFLVETLNNSPYAVTGLAGCKKIDLDKPPAWHLMAEKQDWVGEVKHKKDDIIWTSVFGQTKSRALLIDGLFIAIDVEKIKQTKFNESYKFHHYDLAFCLECNKQKVTVGVMPISVIHHGMGDSMLTEEWSESSEKFQKEYKG
jgi:hypothetical protein